jgi:ABC-type phosphate transport system substrate-binding protein
VSAALRIRVRLVAVAAVALFALFAGILAPAQRAFAASFVPISGSGSTWSYNAIHAWVNDVSTSGMTVDYSANGSPAGLANFRDGVVDWAASEIPYGVPIGSVSNPPPTRRYAYVPDTAGGLACSRTTCPSAASG